MGDLTQAVAQWLKKEPHDKDCPARDVTRLLRPKKRRAGGGFVSEKVRGVCTCNREQRIAARVAAAIDTASVAARMGDSLVAVNEAAVRALTSGEAG